MIFLLKKYSVPERVVDKGCGGCRFDRKEFGETCVDCNEDNCNKEEAKREFGSIDMIFHHFPMPVLNCYNASSTTEQCKSLRDVCYTRDIYGNCWEN